MPDLTPETWAQIRYDYEHTDRPVEDICAEHGISSGTLRNRMRRWHWTRRRSAIPREGPPAFLIVDGTIAPSGPAMIVAQPATRALAPDARAATPALQPMMCLVGDEVRQDMFNVQRKIPPHVGL